MEAVNSAMAAIGIEDENHSKLLEEVRAKLEKGETCLAWVKLLLPVSEEELTTILSTINFRLEDLNKGNEENDGFMLVGGCEMIAFRCIQAYIHGIRKNYQDAHLVIMETRELLDQCIEEKLVNEEYRKGISYALKGLEIIANVESWNPKFLDQLSLRKYIKALDRVEELSQAQTIGLMALKYYFMWNISNKSYFATRLVVQKLMEMDPENPEWPAVLYLGYKFERQKKELRGRDARPCAEEIDSISKAMELPGAEKNVTVMTYDIMCLADLFRTEYNVQKDELKDFKYGPKTFATAEDVVQYLTDRSKAILEVNDQMVRTLFVISRIFSSVLPFKLRKLEFAETCIKRAVSLYPHVSKVNHRMGILYVLKESFDEAIPFLQRAHELDNRNINALVDALYALMPKFDDAAEKLEEMFKEAQTNEFVVNEPGYRSQLLFLEGVYRILRKQDAVGVQKFVEANDNLPSDQEFKHFNNLFREMRRFGWIRNEELRIGAVKGAILKALEAELKNSETDLKMKTVLEKLVASAKGPERFMNREGRNQDQDSARAWRSNNRDDNIDRSPRNYNRDDNNDRPRRNYNRDDNSDRPTRSYNRDENKDQGDRNQSWRSRDPDSGNGVRNSSFNSQRDLQQPRGSYSGGRNFDSPARQTTRDSRDRDSTSDNWRVRDVEVLKPANLDQPIPSSGICGNDDASSQKLFLTDKAGEQKLQSGIPPSPDDSSSVIDENKLPERQASDTDVHVVDHYKVLDVDRKVTRNQLRRAYFRLVHQFHADAAGSEMLSLEEEKAREENMERIKLSYQALNASLSLQE